MARGRFDPDEIVHAPDPGRTAYDAALVPLQNRLAAIQRAYWLQGRSAAIVFEGRDAAGKGGTIRRMSMVMDPRGFRVWPIGAPDGQDARRHYLARFWDRVPERGAIAVFDRSWYGRVLVERVEGFASADEWGRAFDEINAFEAQLIADGTRVVKLFLHIDRDEQYKRLLRRARNPAKRWKLSVEDFRNRSKWATYEDAIAEMFARTHTKAAPWRIVGADAKRAARLEALTHIADTLENGVTLEPPPLGTEISRLARDLFGDDAKNL